MEKIKLLSRNRLDFYQNTTRIIERGVNFLFDLSENIFNLTEVSATMKKDERFLQGNANRNISAGQDAGFLSGSFIR